MRQIEDRWRVDYKDAPNPNEEFMKLMNSFNFNQTQITDISKYRDYVFRRYLSNKCSGICLKINYLNYSNCLSNCYSKLISSNSLMDECIDSFQETYNSYESGGKSYFLN